MPVGDRAGGGEHAERINAAAELAEAGMPAAEAARELAGRFGCSVRQARRYVDQARSGRVPVPQPAAVFTVKLPVRLAAAVPQHAPAAGRTLSPAVAPAPREVLGPGRRDPPRPRPSP